MAKVIVTCGKICSGKTTYAKRICQKTSAVLLSVDEIMLAVFGQNAGENHDAYVESIKAYLFSKSLEMIAAGIDVVLDLGLWTAEERERVKTFYKNHGVVCEIHYIDVTDALWKHRIAIRNQAVLECKSESYDIDENLLAKFAAMFEAPKRNEIDVWIPSE